MFNGTTYVTTKMKHTHNITNNITRHNHNNYEHNVINKVNTHIHHINNYDTDITYYNNNNNKPLNTHSYYNLYHDTFIFRNNDIISNSQHTDIINNITDTSTQTTNYSYENNIDNTKLATVKLNPTPSLNETYSWIP